MPLARTGESDESSIRRPSGRLLLVAGVIVALGAAGALVLSDDLRLLRLGIVAGLWAALVGAFIAARYRGQVADRDDRAADLQAVYELELEREIAARREYELQVEAEIRAEVDEQSRRDVAALRDELRTLRQTLETLLGGEVLVERYALAQSTRMRPLQEQQRKRLPAAVNGPAPEPVTEQFDRVTELRPVKTGPRAVPPLPRRADRPERPAWPTPDPNPPQQPSGGPPVAGDPRIAELPPTPVAQFRPPAAERSASRIERPQPQTPEPPSQGRFRPVDPRAQEVERFRAAAEESLSRIQRLTPQTPEPPPREVEPFRPATAQQPLPRVERPQPQTPEPPSQGRFRPAMVDHRPPTGEQPLPQTGEQQRTGQRLPPRVERPQPQTPEPPSQGRFRPATGEHRPVTAERPPPRVERPQPQVPEPPSQGRFRPATAEHRPPTGEQPLPRTGEQQRTGRSRAAADSAWAAVPPRRASEESGSWAVEPPRQPSQPPAPQVPPPPTPVADPMRTAWEERPVAPPPHPDPNVDDRWFAGGATEPEPAPSREQSRAGRHSGVSEPPATGGRRRRAEPEPEPPGRRHARPEDEPGGRRRRAEETPSWQELAAWDPVVKATSRAWAPSETSHARGDEGSHATGHSVADLLAQHGAEQPRRRRRRED